LVGTGGQRRNERRRTAPNRESIGNK
jgi:hypothetical protein